MNAGPATAAGRQLVIIGAGGHGRVVLDTAMHLGWTVEGFCDPAYPPGQLIDGCAVLGGDGFYEGGGPPGRVYHLGLGGQSAREAVLGRLRASKHALASLIHSGASVSDRATVESGALIMPSAVVNTGATIGACAIINTGAIVEHDVRLGEGAQISPGVVLTGGVRVGAWANVGANATVLPGLTIGEHAVVGAGAVVVRHVEPGTTVVGAPAAVLSRPQTHQRD